MKRWFIIGLFVMLALAACHRPIETQNFASLPPAMSPELSAIDSLMWQRPDSALACLLPYFDTCCAAEHDRHYAHLLLSELLYKNDYAQTNRAELQDAVVYFDSLAQNDNAHTRRRHCGLDPQSPSQKDILAFLAARAHYIYGVGYYEQDSAVPACREYLKALEIMEDRFAEKELVGKKAQFMAYTNNRLGELFSAQYMMEPAIACCEQSLYYCKIAPTSPFGVSSTLLRIGKQFDKLDEIEKASDYYDQALEALPSYQGPIYRDIVASKALCNYQLGLGIGHSLDTIRYVLTQTFDDDERLIRYLTIGDIFFEEGFYDSALVYLEPVFEFDKNPTCQVAAASFLSVIYDSLGYEEKVDECMRLLANQKKSEGQNKALVSQLEGLFQNYLNQKQEQKAAQEKRETVLRTVKILVPTALVVAAVIIAIIRKRGKKHLTQQQQVHQMEQAALSGRLKRSNEKLRDVSKQLEASLAKNSALETKAPDDYMAFLNVPICLCIVRLVHEGQFKAKMDYLVYKESALSKEQLLALRDAAKSHLPRFILQIRQEFPGLNDSDMDYCYLILLGLNEADISALMQRAYTTVCDRSRKISRIIGADDSLFQTLRDRLSDR